MKSYKFNVKVWIHFSRKRHFFLGSFCFYLGIGHLLRLLKFTRFLLLVINLELVLDVSWLVMLLMLLSSKWQLEMTKKCFESEDEMKKKPK